MSNVISNNIERAISNTPSISTYQQEPPINIWGLGSVHVKENRNIENLKHLSEDQMINSDTITEIHNENILRLSLTGIFVISLISVKNTLKPLLLTDMLQAMTSRGYELCSLSTALEAVAAGIITSNSLGSNCGLIEQLNSNKPKSHFAIDGSRESPKIIIKKTLENWHMPHGFRLIVTAR